MAGKLGLEARLAIKELAARKVSNCSIARTLGVSEGNVRYHRKRMAAQAEDGRARQPRKAAAYHGPIAAWVEAQGEGAALNMTALHDWLVQEHAYEGSCRSVQRYFRQAFPTPKRRARRRVETPPGAQAQADWAHFPSVLITGKRMNLYAFHLQLSHSRYAAVVWATSRNQLAWQDVHNQALERLGGVPATVRVDNEKTAVSRCAGAWGEINAAYQRYALAMRFHIDACAPRQPQAKGKVERHIRSHRLGADPRRRHWNDLPELQAWTDERVAASAGRRICPATGTSVREAWEAEKPCLGVLPVLPEPFDLVATRTVRADCMVHFEGRQYSVPFALVGQRVEVRGCTRSVQVLHGTKIVARHARHTQERLLIEPEHFEGEATDRMLPPIPLGRLGRRLQEIAALEPDRRPVDQYAALAEVAR